MNVPLSTLESWCWQSQQTSICLHSYMHANTLILMRVGAGIPASIPYIVGSKVTQGGTHNHTASYMFMQLNSKHCIAQSLCPVGCHRSPPLLLCCSFQWFPPTAARICSCLAQSELADVPMSSSAPIAFTEYKQSGQKSVCNHRAGQTCTTGPIQIWA